MAGKPAKEVPQPTSFAFTKENEKQAKEIIARYPQGRQQSAVMPLLMLAQKQHENWLPRAAIEHVATMLGMPVIRAFEVATFYTMYNLAPVGKYHVQCCTTTPCWLRGSDEIVRASEEYLGIRMGETTEDGMFTLGEAECLGACVNAPMIQVNDVYYEDLTPDSMKLVLRQLRKGEPPKPGPQNGRFGSEPEGGPSTLENQRKAWESAKKKAS